MQKESNNVKPKTADSTLGYAVASQTPMISLNNSIKPGYVNENQYNYNYREVVKDSRHFYQRDPIAGTVINRLVEIAITQIRNRRRNKNSKNALSDEITAYYNSVTQQIRPFLKQIALDYLLHGMSIPEFTTKRIMGNRASDKLGRTRYIFPYQMWTRNIDNIELVKLPMGADRLVYLKVPSDEVRLIKEKGGKDPNKKALYDYYLINFPEYVAAVQRGETRFQLKDVLPIYRKLTNYNVYPLPYMINSIDPMKHKARLKAMDMSIAGRVIEAVRQIKVGNDEYPADDEDLKAEQQSFTAYGNSGEKVFNYFTNHTIEIKWSYPPFEMLLSESKYIEPNREIFFGLGFPRIWTSGETEKSNSSDNRLASVGPLATIEDLQDNIIIWLKQFYEKLAEFNSFDRVPEPYFTPVNTADVANLIQYAEVFYNIGAITKETIAELYGKVWEDEQAQRETEDELTPKEEVNNASPEETKEPEQTNPIGEGVQQENTGNNGDINS